MFFFFFFFFFGVLSLRTVMVKLILFYQTGINGGIHVIFSRAQIGRAAIFCREIGVPDREIFSQQKIFKFNVKKCLFASP